MYFLYWFINFELQFMFYLYIIYKFHICFDCTQKVQVQLNKFIHLQNTK